MLIEARWPNSTFDELLTRSGWADTGSKSTYKLLHDPELANTGIDWTGATAILNIAHQFWTWSRPVLNHRKGGDTFEYDIEMNEFHSRRTHWWADDSYYLIGGLGALDTPGEWCLQNDGKLYIFPPNGSSPADLKIRAKVRDYAFSGSGLDYVVIRGFHFFGCTFSLSNANHCRVEYCSLRFPSFSRGIPEHERPRKNSNGTIIFGDDNRVYSCSLKYCGNFGIRVRGLRNTVENCLIHDLNWSGTLRYPAIALIGERNADRSENVARHNTVYNAGNAIISSHGNRYGTVEYNHVHHGGLLSKDVSLIYTSMPYAEGLEIRYNWVHDSLSPSNSLGIRGDDKTRGLRIHHNVIWNCRRDGIVVKGGQNRVYNNTCFGNHCSDILFMSGQERDKWWQEHITAYQHQNEDSIIVNNTASAICSVRKRRDPGIPGDCSNTLPCRIEHLQNPAGLDFRPADNSPLIDAGREIQGITATFEGRAPDIGAYEKGQPKWLPGHRNSVCMSRSKSDSLNLCLGMPVAEATSLRVAAEGSPSASLSFTSRNWMKPQEVPLELSGPETVVFRNSQWGRAEINTRHIEALSPARSTFEHPDLSSAEKFRAKFNYAEAYQPVDSEMLNTLHVRSPSDPITVDGSLATGEWPDAVFGNCFPISSIDTDAAVPPAGYTFILADEHALYVGAKIRRPPDASPVAKPYEWGTSDGIEVNFQPVSGALTGPVFVLHGFTNGKMRSSRLAGATEAAARLLEQHSQYAVSSDEESWSAEFRIPFHAIEETGIRGKHLRFNIGVRQAGLRGGPWFAIAPTGGANYAVKNAFRLELAPLLPFNTPNLLKNSDFEETTPQGWEPTTNSSDPLMQGGCERVKQGKTGGWCVRISAGEADAAEGRVIKCTFPLADLVTPGTYLLSYDLCISKLRTRGGKLSGFNGYLRTGRADGSGSNVGQPESLLIEDTNGWIHRESLITIPLDCEPQFLSLQLHQAAGTVLIDNVFLAKTGE